MRLSHVLYRVDNLHNAVDRLEKAGFQITYGSKPATAHNAIIWFETGVFIEIYSSPKLPFILQCFMNIAGLKAVAERLVKWQNTPNGWCEWSLETTAKNLTAQKQALKLLDIKFSSFRTSRTDIHQRKLRWELLAPADIHFPFLMSAYSVDPRPAKIVHPNGASGVSMLYVGKENLQMQLLEKLLPSKNGLCLLEGKTGLQGIELTGTDVKIEEILAGC